MASLEYHVECCAVFSQKIALKPVLNFYLVSILLASILVENLRITGCLNPFLMSSNGSIKVSFPSFVFILSSFGDFFGGE
jgi:hypothetical protein